MTSLNYELFFDCKISLTKLNTNSSTNTKNRILAIPAAVPAIPVKPKIAAKIAIIKKVIDQLNITIPPS